MNDYYLYTFASTHAAILTEKLLKPAESRIMPVPRFISASCGISVMIKPENKELAEKIFAEESELTAEEYAYYHIYKDENGEQHCDKLEN
ncbi:MAG: DUF3343 domain-containing protein [Firmicutes bacterium]|mgnify:CR=1 FL=1|nr:DUF3343 domain-containing protein [Bacillota bacterium]